MSTAETFALLEAAQSGDEEAGERVLRENTGLIWSVVRRYNGRGVETEDLYQLGCIGFLKAVKGFDLTYGTQFSTYAVPKIAGEIRRFLRDDGAIKVSRTLRERSQSIYSAREKLRVQLGREPVLSELAEETGLSVEEIADADLASAAPESFQQEMGREEIAAFLGRLVQAAEEGPQAAFALARAQVGQFPRCDSLALNVALTLEGVLTMAGREGSAEEREWIQALYRQAAESRDQAVACQAQARLFGRAMEEGDFAQAEALLDRLPPQPLYDRAQMEARLAQAKGDGDRAGQLLEHQLLQQASGAQTTLLAQLELAGREGRRGDLAPLADKAVALGQLLELAPYGGWSVRLQQACLTRDTDAALAALAGLLGSLETPWPGGTSPLCRHLPRKDGAVLGAKLRPGILRELADPDNPTYAFLRSDPRFWDLVGEAPAAP